MKWAVSFLAGEKESVYMHFRDDTTILMQVKLIYDPDEEISRQRVVFGCGVKFCTLLPAFSPPTPSFTTTELTLEWRW